MAGRTRASDREAVCGCTYTLMRMIVIECLVQLPVTQHCEGGVGGFHVESMLDNGSVVAFPDGPGTCVRNIVAR